jgi:hypothetical protein
MRVLWSSGHSGERRNPAGGRRADTPVGGGQADTPAGTVLALWKREDAEGAPARRGGRTAE